MLPSSLNNPFGNYKLDDTVSLPAGDVPELHLDVLKRCETSLQLARQAGQSSGLLVVGEAGSGKSHLIAQYRKQIALDPHAVLAAIRLGGAYAGRLWRHLRERFVTELLRTYPISENKENGLLRLLRNRFPKWASAQGSGGGLLGVLIGKTSSEDILRQHLQEFVSTSPSFDYKLRKILPLLTNPDLTTLAHDWLRGEQLSADDLKSLRLPPEFPTDAEQENIARSVVLSLLRLAGDKTTLFLCFDEVEAIQSGNYDAPVLQQFATLATELLAETGPRVIGTFIRPNLLIALGKSVEVSNMQKMSQLRASIPSLSWEQTVRVTRSRLGAEPTCQAARQEHPDDLDWPFGPKFLAKLFSENRLNLTPRHLILACRVEFEQLQKGKQPQDTASVPDGPTGGGNTAASLDATEELTRMWEKHRKKHLEKLQSVQFESVTSLAVAGGVDRSLAHQNPRQGP